MDAEVLVVREPLLADALLHQGDQFGEIIGVYAPRERFMRLACMAIEKRNLALPRSIAAFTDQGKASRVRSRGLLLKYS